ncbi:MAG: ABC transporter ATP-binding protein [Pirellulales bacterium]
MTVTAPASITTTDSLAPMLLEVRELSVTFGHQEVLKNISLSIPQGQTLVILGESGCGKTVLLKSMIGLIRPTHGDVLFQGDSLLRMSDRTLAHLRTRYGFVFQGAALFDSYTIADNIAFPLREHTHVSSLEIDDIVSSLTDEVGLPRSALHKKPMELSGGMRKRAGLARALALDPELILYDEPTTGLDPIMSDVINELIMKVQQRPKATSVIVTHDLNTARKVADRIIMLYPLFRLPHQAPQIVFDGTPNELMSSKDHRIQQFVEGRAGNRLTEMQEDYTDSNAKDQQRESENAK